MKKAFRLFLAFALSLLLAGAPAFASTASLDPTVSLSVTVPSSVTVTATPATISFNGTTGVASGAITVATSWNLAASAANFLVDAWFAPSTAALTTGTANIPTSQVNGAVNGGAATPFTGTDTSVTASVAGATLNLFQAATVGASGSRSDSLVLSITGLGTQTPGAYTGTLILGAQAN